MDAHNEPVFEARLVESGSTNPNEKLFRNKFVVLGILFGVTGFLGIPLLWQNPKFSETERIVWSVIVTVYTLALIYGAYSVCMWSYSRITESY